MTEPTYLTVAEVAERLRFTVTAKDPERACWKYLTKKSIPLLRRGRVLLVERELLDAIIRGTANAKRIGGNRQQGCSCGRVA